MSTVRTVHVLRCCNGTAGGGILQLAAAGVCISGTLTPELVSRWTNGYAILDMSSNVTVRKTNQNGPGDWPESGCIGPAVAAFQPEMKRSKVAGWSRVLGTCRYVLLAASFFPPVTLMCSKLKGAGCNTAMRNQYQSSGMGERTPVFEASGDSLQKVPTYESAGCCASCDQLRPHIVVELYPTCYPHRDDWTYHMSIRRLQHTCYPRERRFTCPSGGECAGHGKLFFILPMHRW